MSSPAAFRIDDFPLDYRVAMVRAYPIISGVPDMLRATWEQIDEGFDRCLAVTNLRRTHEFKLEELAAARGEGTK